MKIFAAACVTLLTAKAIAGITSAEGKIAVDPIWRSEDAAILIRGEAAKQLYLHLSIDGGGDEVKIGKRVLCRKSLIYDGKQAEFYECEMTITPVGDVVSR